MDLSFWFSQVIIFSMFSSGFFSFPLPVFSITYKPLSARLESSFWRPFQQMYYSAHHDAACCSIQQKSAQVHKPRVSDLRNESVAIVGVRTDPDRKWWGRNRATLLRAAVISKTKTLSICYPEWFCLSSGNCGLSRGRHCEMPTPLIPTKYLLHGLYTVCVCGLEFKWISFKSIKLKVVLFYNSQTVKKSKYFQSM